MLDDCGDLLLPPFGQYVIDFCIEKVAAGIVEVPRAQHQQRRPLIRRALVQEPGVIFGEGRQRYYCD
jgi:hypothetical protein